MSNYILGGGLAGLIWGACHHDSLIIEKGLIGGMVHNNLGPMMIKHTLQSEEFVRNLGMDVRLKEIMVGYTYGDDFLLGIPPEGFKEQYVSHSRKIPISEVSNSGHKSMMNSSQNSFLTIEINMQEFIDAMIARILDTGGHILKGSVSSIAPRTKNVFIDYRYDEGTEITERLTYDSVTSTLPMYVLKRLVYNGYNEISNKCFPRWNEIDDYVMHKVFVSIKGVDANYFRDNCRGIDFIYSVPKDDRFIEQFLTRIIPYGKYPVLEFTVPINEAIYNSFLEDLEYELCYNKIEHNTTVLKNSMIRRNVGLKECRGIKMVGRYAQWDHSIRLHNVIAEAME